jgi:hypothetical protein
VRPLSAGLHGCAQPLLLARGPYTRNQAERHKAVNLQRCQYSSNLPKRSFFCGTGRKEPPRPLIPWLTTQLQSTHTNHQPCQRSAFFIIHVIPGHRNGVGPLLLSLVYPCGAAAGVGADGWLWCGAQCLSNFDFRFCGSAWLFLIYDLRPQNIFR